MVGFGWPSLVPGPKRAKRTMRTFYQVLGIAMVLFVHASSKELRRLTLQELESDPYFMTGAQPFVLTGAWRTGHH